MNYPRLRSYHIYSAVKTLMKEALRTGQGPISVASSARQLLLQDTPRIFDDLVTGDWEEAARSAQLENTDVVILYYRPENRPDNDLSWRWLRLEQVKDTVDGLLATVGAEGTVKLLVDCIPKAIDVNGKDRPRCLLKIKALLIRLLSDACIRDQLPASAWNALVELHDQQVRWDSFYRTDYTDEQVIVPMISTVMFDRVRQIAQDALGRG